MSGIEQKRAFVSKMYPGKGWRNSVKKMPDKQIVAIYFHEMKRREKLAKEAKQKPKESSDDIPF